MNDTQLEVFVKVAELLSFSEAAKVLFLTQPTVSYQVKSLENELRVKLFAREGTAVTLTSEGETFLAAARGMLKIRDGVLKELTPSMGKPELVLGLPRIMFVSLLHEHNHRFVKSLEKELATYSMQVQVGSEKELLDGLLDGTMDIIVIGGQLVPEGDSLTRETLCDARTFAMVPKEDALGDASTIAVDALRDRTIILCEDAEIFNATFLDNFDDVQHVRVRMVDNYGSMNLLVQSGEGVGILPAPPVFSGESDGMRETLATTWNIGFVPVECACRESIALVCRTRDVPLGWDRAVAVARVFMNGE